MATRQTPGTRAKDSDRNDTCAVLDSALADGQLSGEEHRQRVASATSAATLGELQSLVADLQTNNAPVQLPTLKSPSRLAGSGWGIKAAIAGVLVLLGIGIGWGLYGNTSSPLSFQTDPGAKSDGVPAKVLTPPRQLQSLGGLNGLFEQMRQKFGDTTGYEMTVYPDYAVLQRPDPTEDRRTLSYYYKGGFDDPNETSKSGDARLGDLAKFDTTQVVGLLRGAPETLGIKPGDVKTTYLIIQPSEATPDAVDITIYVSDQFNSSGYIEVKGDGTQRVNYPS